MPDFPKTLLITRWPSDGRYAGAEVMRRIMRHLGPDTVRWASFSSPSADPPSNDGVRGYFPARPIHWRLRGGFVEYLLKKRDAGCAADKIIAWLGDVKPEVIWVVAELEAISLAVCLKRKLGLPVHATFFDAPENSKLFMGQKWLYSMFRYELQKFAKEIMSFDVVSPELLDHMSRQYGMDRTRGVVFPPSIDMQEIRNLPPVIEHKRWRDNLRKIGFCGAMRVDTAQWVAFIKLLEGLPFLFEIHMFSTPELAPHARDAQNMKIIYHEYTANEMDIINFFIQEEVDACYLGLWRDQSHELFSRTSLSSKLTTYLLAGVPVIVDAPELSAVWQMVSRLKCGLIIDAADSREISTAKMIKLLTNSDYWKDVSQHARASIVDNFNLGKGLERIKCLMSENQKRIK